MSTQKKLSEITVVTEERIAMAKVLDLEKKYFNILWELFTSNEFIHDLKTIEIEIQKQYAYLQHTWELKNKLKIPAERLVRQYIYKELSHLISHIYPSAVSSDIAFITEDAVINLDVKTLDSVGNRGDIFNLQFENNQSSFINKNLDMDSRFPNSGVKVECMLPMEYSYDDGDKLPVLTYFLTVVYSDNKRSFKLCREADTPTIFLKCLPNGIISALFDFDIVDNFKTYDYLDHKHGCLPIYLTDDATLLDYEVEKFIRAHSDQFVLIRGRTKVGAFAFNQVHPKQGTIGISWFPVSRQDKLDKEIRRYYLEAVNKGNTNRVSNDKLIQRFDSNDNSWYGLKKKNIE